MLLSDEIRKTINTLVAEIYTIKAEEFKAQFKAHLIDELTRIANNFLHQIREDTLNSQGRDFEVSLVRSINIYRRAVEDSNNDWKKLLAESHLSHLFDEEVNEIYKFLHMFLEDHLYQICMQIYEGYPKAISAINRIYKDHKFEHREYNHNPI